jgi:hypothetical protein
VEHAAWQLPACPLVIQAYQCVKPQTAAQIRLLSVNDWASGNCRGAVSGGMLAEI